MVAEPKSESKGVGETPFCLLSGGKHGATFCDLKTALATDWTPAVVEEAKRADHVPVLRFVVDEQALECRPVTSIVGCVCGRFDRT